MDGNDMLEKLTPDLDEEGRKAILKDQGRRFEKHYLPNIKPIPGVRKTLSALKAMGCRIGLATDCDGPPLRRYRKILKIDEVWEQKYKAFQILAAQDQLRVARRNLAAAERILTLIKQQFAGGTSSQLDVSQPTFVPVSPHVSRRYCTSSVRGSTS